MGSRHQIPSSRVLLCMHEYLFFNEFKFLENLMLECEFSVSLMFSFLKKNIFGAHCFVFFSKLVTNVWLRNIVTSSFSSGSRLLKQCPQKFRNIVCIYYLPKHQLGSQRLTLNNCLTSNVMFKRNLCMPMEVLQRESLISKIYKRSQCCLNQANLCVGQKWFVLKTEEELAEVLVKFQG